MEQKSKTKTSTPIHLKDIGIDFRIVEKPLKEVKIKTTPQGVEISVPTVRKDKRDGSIAVALGLLTVAGIAIILELLLSLLGKSSMPEYWWGRVAWLGFLLILQVVAIPIVAKSLFGKEKIMFSKKTLKIGNYIFGKSKLRIGQENTYDIMNISNLRLVSQEHGLQGKDVICFDYGDQTTGFCNSKCCRSIRASEIFV